MVSSLQFPSLSLLPNKLQCNYPLIGPWIPSPSSRIKPTKKLLPLASSSRRSPLTSWTAKQESSTDGFGGWFSREPEIEDTRGIPKIVLAGVGASMAILIGVFGYYSFSKGGFKFRFVVPFHNLCEILTSSESKKVPVEVKKSTALEDDQASDTMVTDKLGMGSDMLTANMKQLPDVGQNKRIIVPIAADPIQQGALCVLKKLKIIEDDAGADQLCTRREYVRWLVKENCMLERNPKHRINSTGLTGGSTITAFDDVSVSDPDFWCIQALGESGITVNKLSNVNSGFVLENSDGQGRFNFLPESFISRFDMVNWKAMLEYPFNSEVKEKVLIVLGGKVQISRANVGLFDLSASCLDSSPHLKMDLMAGDKSITRKVFGNIRRLQPQKPVTKAQVAVALTSGRMAGAISAELARLEADNQAKLAEIEEIRLEIIQRGEIQRFWDEKLKIERERGIEIERDMQVALLDLEEEKEARNGIIAEYTKQKAALDYQQKLLHSLREEVDVMYLKLANDRANLLAEQHSSEKLFNEVRAKQDAIVEAKSILEAEKEALRMLRYWVEEEGRKVQSRAKNLEQAALRWKWN